MNPLLKFTRGLPEPVKWVLFITSSYGVYKLLWE